MLTDGFYARWLHRPVARYLVAWVPRFVSANSVTVLSFMVGSLGAASIVWHHPVSAILLLQVYCVMSCLDGEVARSRTAVSRKGDFLDTITDRIVEFTIIVALLHLFLRARRPSISALGAMFLAYYLITYSSEKYRSTFGRGFPKNHDGIFVYVSSGIDARLSMYCLSLAIGAVFPDRQWGEHFFILLQAVIALNVAYRIALVLGDSDQRMISCRTIAPPKQGIGSSADLGAE